MTATIERLTELLEAERAGVETMSRLLDEATTPETRALFEALRDDEAWCCAGLAEAIQRQGGTLSKTKGDFIDKVMAEPSLPARLRLLNRGQGWVLRRLDALLATALDEESRAFLTRMRAAHARNIERCETLIARLAASMLDVRALSPRERHPTIFTRFEQLGAGEGFILINDHDPKPLYYQFAAERAEQFTWRYLETGPEVWRVEIGKP